MSAFAGPWPEKGSLVLRRARIPRLFLERALGADDGACLLADIFIEDGRVARLLPAGQAPDEAGLAVVDCAGRQVWPTLVDMHTHLDRAHSLSLAPNPDGTFAGARAAMARLRGLFTPEDTAARMDFALRAAHARGVSAIRTHVDSRAEIAEANWALFADMRARWAGRVELQGVALLPVETYATPEGEELAERVADLGGCLGGVAEFPVEGSPDELARLRKALAALMRLARRHDLDVDLHVDETADPRARALELVAKAAIEAGHVGRVVCGHCSSLALQEEAVVKSVLELARRAGLRFVTLPTANLMLQERLPGRTPRWRGVTLLHEIEAAGLPIAIAGDNCRDAFYPYGDGDILDTFRHAVPALHLYPEEDASLAMIGPVPASICGFAGHGLIGEARAADLILFQASTVNEVLSRPDLARKVVRAGIALTEPPPAYPLPGEA
ncbi:cytosine deaminase [Afifella pfennigii]|uniref:cytosine deaminase n=1 Tax=Afifella pfennigii TaxID=209897 RepID=UPI00047BD2B3|nr:cytosine deaminase [Afifella pfennigii]